MASFNIICERIFSENSSWKRLLFGGLLCLSIVGIPFAAGYLFHYAVRLRAEGEVSLPSWEGWTQRLTSGFHFLAVFAIWYLVIALFGFAVGWVVHSLAWEVLWWPVYLIIMSLNVLAPVCFAAALRVYLERQCWEALFEVKTILGVILRPHWLALLFPGVTWVGLLVIALPLFPFTFFLGLTLLLAYYIPLFSGSPLAQPVKRAEEAS